MSFNATLAQVKIIVCISRVLSNQYEQITRIDHLIGVMILPDEPPSNAPTRKFKE